MQGTVLDVVGFYSAMLGIHLTAFEMLWGI